MERTRVRGGKDERIRGEEEAQGGKEVRLRLEGEEKEEERRKKGGEIKS